MKYLICGIIAAMYLSLSAKSQNYSSFAHTSKNRDTLYLLSTDSLSYLTYKIWKEDTNWNGTNPYIMFVSPSFVTNYIENFYKKN